MGHLKYKIGKPTGLGFFVIINGNILLELSNDLDLTQIQDYPSINVGSGVFEEDHRGIEVKA